MIERFSGLVAKFRDRFAPIPEPARPDVSLENRFCPVPFKHFEVTPSRDVFLCCQAWLPTSAGSIDGRDVDDIWNSVTAQSIRTSILDGSFSYCNKDLCPKIQANNLPTLDEARDDPSVRPIIEQGLTVMDGIPKIINLAYDRSCNLSCPSCRTEKILENKGQIYDFHRRTHGVMVDAFFSDPCEQSFTINVTGSGDPFASRIYREFLHELDGSKFPNMKLDLQTNGVLFNAKEWKRLHKIHLNINLVMVSFDAGTEATYNVTRVGGQWRLLLENMAMLGQLRREGKIKCLRIDYVVQDTNFREMETFVELCRPFSPDTMQFSIAVNWGTWTSAQYKQKCVWDTDHPDHDEFLTIMARPVFSDPLVQLGNLTQYRRRALMLVGEDTVCRAD